MRIVAAAINYGGKIYQGKRHAEIMRQIWEGLDEAIYISQEIQGFVTDSGRFVSRTTAAKIAFAAGQIVRSRDLLTSEDLW